MQFTLSADIKFLAKDLEDASCIISDHFRRVAGFHINGNELIFEGKIELKPTINNNIYSVCNPA
jgi:hypothetical protein